MVTNTTRQSMYHTGQGHTILFFNCCSQICTKYDDCCCSLFDTELNIELKAHIADIIEIKQILLTLILLIIPVPLNLMAQ